MIWTNIFGRRILPVLLSRSVGTLVVAEQSGTVLSESTRTAISASSALNNKVTCLLTSDDLEPIKEISEQISNIHGVQHVLLAQNSISGLVPLIINLVKSGDYTCVVAGSSALMRDSLSRVAAKLGVSMASDVTAIVGDVFERRLYAGNVLSSFKWNDAVRVMTVRGFKGELSQSASPAPIETISESYSDPNYSTVISRDIPQSDRPGLTTARVVVSGGRGLKSAEHFNLIYQLADSLKAAVGATRAAVDAGFVSNDLQVGQTGKVVTPDLYIAVGISGAIQHLAGMKDSRTVVAIDKNEDAPIFDYCDYGVVGDLFEIVPQLTQLIKDSP